jgi:formylglycine-generating enzyme required for sulfatase activity
LRGVEDFDKVQDGDVLVVPYSDVGWLPLFAKAGAVIAESGEMLSDSSIIAREYGIPAVVAVEGATKMQDQTLVTVNGQNGEVLIHSDRGEKVSDNLILNHMEFCHVPAGSFLMGSNNKEKTAQKDEKPQHIVETPYDYWMARFPVTNEQYYSFMQAKNGVHPVQYWKLKLDHPVVRVSWVSAMHIVVG